MFVAGQDHELRNLSWPTQLISLEIYDEIAVELSETPPARFIIRDDAYDDMALRAPETLAVIEEMFCVAQESGRYNYLLRATDPLCP